MNATRTVTATRERLMFGPRGGGDGPRIPGPRASGYDVLRGEGGNHATTSYPTQFLAPSPRDPVQRTAAGEERVHAPRHRGVFLQRRGHVRPQPRGEHHPPATAP